MYEMKEKSFVPLCGLHRNSIFLVIPQAMISFNSDKDCSDNLSLIGSTQHMPKLEI